MTEHERNGTPRGRRPDSRFSRRTGARNGDRNGSANGSAPFRIATYSPGMVGFGHIRRNASIAQALRSSALQPAVMMIAEAWQAGTIPMPPGVDCVTLPALRKESDGGHAPRFAEVSNGDLVDLRIRVIREALQSFDPDVLIVDHLPLGAARELAGTLQHLRRRGHTRCVLGLRDVLQDPDTVRRLWSDGAYMKAVRELYDVVWVYADPQAYDLVRECRVFDPLANRMRYTGYLDQRPRLELARSQAEGLLSSLPPGRLALCLVGGGIDGKPLIEAFAQADLPDDMSGLIVTGPYMPEEERKGLLESIQGRPRMRWIDFLPEPIALVERADRVLAMGGYNTICEVLSLEKHALIVPRVEPSPEQWIRAERMRELGLVEVLHPDRLDPRAVGEWLARDLGPPPPCRRRIDLDGLTRIPRFLADLVNGSEDGAQSKGGPKTPARRAGR